MFEKARTSFHIIRFMSMITFGIGVASIIIALYFASTSGNTSNNNVLTIVFGGTGITSFVAHFIFAPATRIQIAMSNLLQAEIASVNYLNQMAFWLDAIYSSTLEEGKCASKELCDITKETIEMLEQYMEEDGGNKGSREKPSEKGHSL